MTTIANFLLTSKELNKLIALFSFLPHSRHKKLHSPRKAFAFTKTFTKLILEYEIALSKYPFHLLLELNFLLIELRCKLTANHEEISKTVLQSFGFEMLIMEGFIENFVNWSSYLHIVVGLLVVKFVDVLYVFNQDAMVELFPQFAALPHFDQRIQKNYHLANTIRIYIMDTELR